MLMTPCLSRVLQAARLGDVFVNQMLPTEWSSALSTDASQAIAASHLISFFAMLSAHEDGKFAEPPSSIAALATCPAGEDPILVVQVGMASRGSAAGLAYQHR